MIMGWRRWVTLGWGFALSVGVAACAAPRDPSLERAVLSARLAKADAPAEAAPQTEVSSLASAPATPLKSYSNAEIAAILGAVPGTGSRLIATFDTERGVIHCTLDDRAPQTVANFVALAEGQVTWHAKGKDAVKARLYDGLTFHRVVQNTVIQTGNPSGAYNDGPGWTIARELGAADRFQAAGALAMVDSGDQAHGSQLFITVQAAPSFADRYSAFGHCDAPEVVRAIADAPKKAATQGGSPSTPEEPVVIRSVRVTRGE